MAESVVAKIVCLFFYNVQSNQNDAFVGQKIIDIIRNLMYIAKNKEVDHFSSLPKN